jgi:cholesterol transport system auxiliary component
MYRLPPPVLTPSGDGGIDLSLRVGRPTANGLLASARIAVIPGGNTLSAYANAVWNAPVPLLWRDHILDAFHKDGRIRRLSSDSDGLQADYELGGTLRSFQIEYFNGEPRVVISLDVRLIDTTTRRILVGRRFTAVEDVSGEDVSEVVAAFGRASDAQAQEVIAWTVDLLRPLNKKTISQSLSRH